VVVVRGAPLVVSLCSVALPLRFGQACLGLNRALGQVVEVGLELLVAIPPTREHELRLLLPTGEDLAQVERQRDIVRDGCTGAAVTPALASRVPKLSSPTDHRTLLLAEAPPLLPHTAGHQTEGRWSREGPRPHRYMAKGTRRV
jgi:hypothetical protein